MQIPRVYSIMCLRRLTVRLDGSREVLLVLIVTCREPRTI
jgi:hypothetical protein